MGVERGLRSCSLFSGDRLVPTPSPPCWGGGVSNPSVAAIVSVIIGRDREPPSPPWWDGGVSNPSVVAIVSVTVDRDRGPPSPTVFGMGVGAFSDIFVAIVASVSD